MLAQDTQEPDSSTEPKATDAPSWLSIRPGTWTVDEEDPSSADFQCGRHAVHLAFTTEPCEGEGGFYLSIGERDGVWMTADEIAQLVAHLTPACQRLEEAVRAAACPHCGTHRTPDAAVGLLTAPADDGPDAV